MGEVRLRTCFACLSCDLFYLLVFFLLVGGCVAVTQRHG